MLLSTPLSAGKYVGVDHAASGIKLTRQLIIDFAMQTDCL